MASDRASGRLTIASAQSEGVFSHLWASTAHDWASLRPATRGSKRGEAAAHKPNAPSTCSHAPCSAAASAIGDSGSQAQEAKRPQDGDMNLGADQDLNRRRAEQALFLCVPAQITQQRSAGGGQA